MQLAQRVKDMCEQTCGEVNYYAAYSGRGMYGKQCVGITGNKGACMRVIAEVIKESRQESPEGDDRDFEEVVDTLLGFSQDSMGYDVIIYWEDLEPCQEEEEETQDDVGA